jgi:hypothetical protein
MRLVELLRQSSAEIVDEAAQALQRSRLRHYEEMGPEFTHERLRALFGLTVAGVERRTTTDMREHADRLARERFAADFDLQEVQTAFNVLEEAIWKRVLTDLDPAEFAQALGLVSTVLGVGKDTLARTYVSLASRQHAPSLDLRALFAGTDGV